MDCKKIGKIYNYYGCLNVTKKNWRYYWIIEDYDTDMDNIDNWEEIDKELYDSLISYQNRLDKKISK